MIKSTQKQPGDVVIRKNDAGHRPAYVLSTIPGPDQVGCATQASAIGLAQGYGAHAGVDVWYADGTGASVTAVAQFRGLAPRSAPVRLPARRVVWANQSAWARPAGP